MARRVPRRRFARYAVGAGVVVLGAGALARLLTGGAPVDRRAIRGTRTGLVWEPRGPGRVAHHFVEFDVGAGIAGPVRVQGPWWPSAWGFTDTTRRRFRAGFRWPFDWPYPGPAGAWTLVTGPNGCPKPPGADPVPR